MDFSEPARCGKTDQSQHGIRYLQANHQESGLPDIPFHGLRHTYATHSIAVGVDEKTLAKELGHTKPGFTLDCYAHVTEEMQKRASEVTGNALEKILGKELKPWADERTDKG